MRLRSPSPTSTPAPPASVPRLSGLSQRHPPRGVHPGPPPLLSLLPGSCPLFQACFHVPRDFSWSCLSFFGHPRKPCLLPTPPCCHTPPPSCTSSFVSPPQVLVACRWCPPLPVSTLGTDSIDRTCRVSMFADRVEESVDEGHPPHRVKAIQVLVLRRPPST